MSQAPSYLSGAEFLSRRAKTAIWVGIGLVFVAMVMAVILTRSPWWDEGNAADPAHTLAQAGYLGSRILDGKGHPLIREFPGFDHYTYWTVPLYLVTLAGWIKVFGFSIVSMRVLSAIFGGVTIIAGASFARNLTRSPLVGVLAALFLATDYTLILSASTVRMDIMVAALGFGALAAYVKLREKNLMRAALAGGALTAAACFAHPVGLIHTGGLLLTAVFLDRKRLNWRHFAIAAVPYLAAAALWGIYIAQAPDIFLLQISAHAKNRLGGLHSPLKALLMDVTGRYLVFFLPENRGAGAKLKILILLTYWAGILLAVVTPVIRRSPGVPLLILLSGLYYVELALLDGSQFPHYMVHVISMWALLLAAVSGFAISNRLLPRPFILTALGGFVVLQLSGHIFKIRSGPNQNDYLAAIAFVEAHSSSDTLVMGPSELQFNLHRRLVDDARLGGLTGLTPGVIVFDWYHLGPERFEGREPDMQRYVAKMLTERFYLAATYGEFKIYLPRAAAVNTEPVR